MGTKHLTDKVQCEIRDHMKTICRTLGYLSEALNEIGELDHDCEDKLREAAQSAAIVIAFACEREGLQ